MSTALYCLGFTRPYGAHAAPSRPPVPAHLARWCTFALLAAYAAWVPLRWQAACLAGDFRRAARHLVPAREVEGTARRMPPSVEKEAAAGAAPVTPEAGTVPRNGALLGTLPRLQTPDRPPWATGEMPAIGESEAAA
jgi:hypothetical protein